MLMMAFSMEKQQIQNLDEMPPIGKYLIPIIFTFYVDDGFFNGKVTNTKPEGTSPYR